MKIYPMIVALISLILVAIIVLVVNISIDLPQKANISLLGSKKTAFACEELPGMYNIFLMHDDQCTVPDPHRIGYVIQVPGCEDGGDMCENYEN